MVEDSIDFLAIVPPSPKPPISVQLEVANPRVRTNPITGVIETVFDHRVVTNQAAFTDGAYTIDVTYRRVIGGIDQITPVDTFKVGDLNLSFPFNPAIEPGDYNLIEITAGRGRGFDFTTGHEIEIIIEPPPPIFL